MTDEPNIKNDDRLAGGGEWLDDAANTLRNVEEPETADALLAGVAALRQRCEQAEADAGVIAAALVQAERERDEAVAWRASWVVERVPDPPFADVMRVRQANDDAFFLVVRGDHPKLFDFLAAIAHDAGGKE